ncbi:9316_t:CDS:2, partial [Racocetra persica]
FTMIEESKTLTQPKVYHTNTIEVYWQVIKAKILPRECRYLFSELLVFIWKKQNPHDQFEAFIKCLQNMAKLSTTGIESDIIKESEEIDEDPEKDSNFDKKSYLSEKQKNPEKEIISRT